MKLIAIILSLLLPGTKADHCSATPWDRDDELTESQTPGPYYIKDFNFKGNRFVPAKREDGEERLVVSGHVLDNNCHHIPCAEIEVWGTDPVGGMLALLVDDLFDMLTSSLLVSHLAAP